MIGFMCCRKKRCRAQITVYVSPSSVVREVVRSFVINVTSLYSWAVDFVVCYLAPKAAVHGA